MQSVKIEELLTLLKAKDDRLSRNLRCALQDYLRNKGFTMTIIFCSMFLNACTTLEPLNAIDWLDDMSQEELTEAREHIGLKHHEHYEEKRILDAIENR